MAGALLVTVLAWRARVVYQLQTHRFLARLAATTAMTELLASDWVHNRIGEVELLAGLIEPVTMTTGVRSVDADRVLASAFRRVADRAGLRGLWVVEASGTVVAGLGAPLRGEALARLAERSGQDSVHLTTDYDGSARRLTLVIARSVATAGKSPHSEPVLLVALYDPLTDLLPLILDVPVPTEARNLVYVKSGRGLVELTMDADSGIALTEHEIPPGSVMAALGGRDTVGPDLTSEGERVHASARRLERLDWVLARTADRDVALRDAFWPQFGGEAVTVVAAAFGVLILLGSHRRSLARAELEAELARSELRRLQLHLQPHFLLNVLGGAQAVARTDPDRSAELLSRIADFLHATLRTAGAPEISLGRELELLGEYIAVEEFRLGSSLEVVIDVAPELHGAIVPTLVLQPLAENSIRHGFRGPDQVTVIRIAADRSGGQLVLRVEDNGDRAPLPGTGFGLAGIGARLQQLYGPGASLDMRRGPGAGTVVEVVLPFRLSPDAD